MGRAETVAAGEAGGVLTGRASGTQAQRRTGELEATVGFTETDVDNVAKVLDGRGSRCP